MASDILRAHRKGGVITTSDEQLEALTKDFVDHEAGVAEAFELYLRIEDIYVKASAAGAEEEPAYVSDSTNLG